MHIYSYLCIKKSKKRLIKRNKVMSETSDMRLMADVDEVLTKHEASVREVMMVADRLLVSAFRNIAENNVDCNIEALAATTLDTIRQHIRQSVFYQNEIAQA